MQARQVEDGIGYYADLTSASLNAFPYRSPRGHFHITAQEVAMQPFLSLSYLLANKFAEIQ